ncbi:hypothetical protein J6590_027157 [Homalodisca vitripennis]|nr:hypothetical protein J6590_027157 [Homalodisca vitripennis]
MDLHKSRDSRSELGKRLRSDETWSPIGSTSVLNRSASEYVRYFNNRRAQAHRASETGLAKNRLARAFGALHSVGRSQ